MSLPFLHLACPVNDGCVLSRDGMLAKAPSHSDGYWGVCSKSTRALCHSLRD